MLDFMTILRKLCEIPTVSGTERNAETIKEWLTPYFDEIYTDNARNIILRKKSSLTGAPTLMLDAHIDEVGFLVTDITECGFLKIKKVGGTDPDILSGAEVTVLANEPLYGVVVPTQTDRENGKKKPDSFFVDIGYSHDDSVKLVPIGTAVRFFSRLESLSDSRIVGSGLDDKSCAAALIAAVSEIERDDMRYDVFVTLSAGEEVGGGGAGCAAYYVHPDAAIITDVNFALTPSLSADDCGKMGNGPMISLSAETDRKLTSKIISIAEKMNLPVQKSVEPTSTGTNAACVTTMGEGIPTVVLGLPISGMHTFCEALHPNDADSVIKLIKEIICCGEL